MNVDRDRYRFIDSDAEQNEISAKYSVDDWYIDVFSSKGAGMARSALLV